MSVQHVTPDNYMQFVTPTGISYDPRQYLPAQTIGMLVNRAGIHRTSAEQMVRTMRGIADALDVSKPTAFKGLPDLEDGTPSAYLNSAERFAEMQRLRTMADFIESRLAEFNQNAPEVDHG